MTLPSPTSVTTQKRQSQIRKDSRGCPLPLLTSVSTQKRQSQIRKDSRVGGWLLSCLKPCYSVWNSFLLSNFSGSGLMTICILDGWTLPCTLYSQLFKKEFLQSKVQQDLAQNKRRACYLSWRKLCVSATQAIFTPFTKISTEESRAFHTFYNYATHATRNSSAAIHYTKTALFPTF